MSDPIGEHNIPEYLTAFADGQLDAGQILTVLEYLATHPEGLEMMRAQQRLRVAAERAVRAAAPPVPDDLRRRIEAMTPDLPAAAPPPPPPDVPRRRWRRSTGWIAAVAAAALAAVLLVDRILFTRGSGARQVAAGRDAEPLPADVVNHAIRAHAECPRAAEGVHDRGYPPDLAQLRAAVATDLGGGRDPHPDLSGIGYQFVGARRCSDALGDAVHLVYRTTVGDHVHAVSVFAQPYRGQFSLEPGRLYVATPPRSPLPMYAWRTDRVVYFLVADDEPTIDRARTTIAAAPPRS